MSQGSFLSFQVFKFWKVFNNIKTFRHSWFPAFVWHSDIFCDMPSFLREIIFQFLLVSIRVTLYIMRGNTELLAILTLDDVASTLSIFICYFKRSRPGPCIFRTLISIINVVTSNISSFSPPRRSETSIIVKIGVALWNDDIEMTLLVTSWNLEE